MYRKKKRYYIAVVIEILVAVPRYISFDRFLFSSQCDEVTIHHASNLLAGFKHLPAMEQSRPDSLKHKFSSASKSNAHYSPGIETHMQQAIAPCSVLRHATIQRCPESAWINQRKHYPVEIPHIQQ